MNTTTLQITFNNADLSIFKLKTKVIETERDDFYYDLSADDLANIEKSKEQIRLGLYRHSSEVHKRIQEKYGITL